jgi:NAD(P)H-flavin reductase/ferredoxin
MAKAVNLLFNGHVYTCQPDETVLDALLRQGVPVPFMCKKQTCLDCMMRSLNSTPPILSQRELNESLQLQNYFLACACYPSRDMEIALRHDIQTSQVSAKILEKNPLHPNITELILECESPLAYYGGQTVLLLNAKHLGRKLAIASPGSAAQSRRLEVHVERFSKDCFSKWVFESLAVNESVYLSNVRGELFYKPGLPQQSLLLVNWGGNLAAMIGLLQDIFENGHTGAVTLFQGVQAYGQLYLQAELQEIGRYFPNFRYIPCIERGSMPTNGLQTTVDTAVARLMPNLAGWKVFVYGSQAQVSSIQRLAYLARAAMKDIHSEVVSV